MEGLSQKISEFIQQRAQARLEKLDKAAEKALKNSDDASALKAEQAVKRLEEQQKYTPRTWLTDAAKRAKQITLVTHAIKYSHSDAKGSSVLVNETGLNTPMLVTASLKSKDVDVVGNAAALDVAGLLRLASGGEVLVDLITAGDTRALQPFADSTAQLNDWMQGFSQALVDQAVRSHCLAKQLYFPLNASANNGYHIISPLFATSLAGELHARIQQSMYSDASKAARKARRAGVFSEHRQVNYPNIAAQTFGGTKPQNISLLNSSRRGRAYLLPCQPPKWRNLAKPPMEKHTFWRDFDRRAWKTAKQLQYYLTEKLLQDSTFEIRTHRASLVDTLVDTFLIFVTEIRTMKGVDDWSVEANISQAQKCLLDPKRAEHDADFKWLRESGDWQVEIAQDFAIWLNQTLKTNKLRLGDVEYQVWEKLLKRKLVLLRDDLAVLS